MRDASADRLIQKMISTRMRESSEDCADENTMAAYLEESLSPQERSAFEDHVSECISCQEILALSMKLRADEATGQTAAEPETGKKTLFHFSIPIPVLGGVVVAMVLLAVLFRMVHQSGGNLQQPQTAELHPPAQKTETAAQSVPMEAPMADKDNLAMARRRIEAPLSENKEKGSAFFSREAVPEPLPPAALPAIENEPAAVAEVSTHKMAAALPASENERRDVAAESSAQKPAAARASSGYEKSATLSSPAAVSDQIDVKLQSTVTLNSVPPKDVIFGFRDGRSKLEASQSKQIRDKVFYQNSGFWIDRQCVEHRDEPIIEILPVVPEYEPILAKYPELRDLLPAVIYWNNKIYLLR